MFVYSMYMAVGKKEEYDKRRIRDKNDALTLAFLRRHGSQAIRFTEQVAGGTCTPLTESVLLA